MKLLPLFTLIQSCQPIYVWDYENEVPPTTPAGFGRRVERSTFSDIFETLSKGTSIDQALERVLRVTPRSETGAHKVRFPPEPSPFTTPRPPVRLASPTPRSFSEIFQPRPPLVLAAHSDEQLRQLTTTQRIDDETVPARNVAMTTLKTLLDHFRKKNEDKFEKRRKEINLKLEDEEEESEYDYEYVYDYVEVDNSREEKAFTTPRPVQKKSRPKIVPKQRVVHSDSEFHHRNRGENKFGRISSIVTAAPINIGAPVTRYNDKTDTLDIINPPIIIQEPPATRRAGYTYPEPDNRLELTPREEDNAGSAYYDDTPEAPLTPSLQTNQRPATPTPKSFSGIFEGVAYNDPVPDEPLTPSLQNSYDQPTTSTNTGSFDGVAYNDPVPEEPLTPSLQSSYDPPTENPVTKQGRKKFGYKYSAPDDQRNNFNKGGSYEAPMVVKEERPPQEVVMVSAPTPKFDTSYNAPPPRQPPPSYETSETKQQPPVSYEAPEIEEQPPPPPVTYDAPKIEEQPPPSTYSPSFAPEQPPDVYQRPTTRRTTQRTTTRRVVTERPPVTYAPAFIEEEELPPYKPEKNLPSYQDNLPEYNNEPVFVTPRSRPPPKLRLVGKKSKESISMVNPRSGQGKFAFSTLLPSMNSIATTTPKPARTSTLSSFSDIFSNLQRNEEKPRTSYKNNAPPPTFFSRPEEEESYGQPLGKPLGGKPITTSNDGSRFPLYDDLTPPTDYSYEGYDDYEEDDDVTISGVDPRFNENFVDAVSDNPSFDISEKLQRARDDYEDGNDLEQTTRIKGILKKPSKPFSRFTDNRSPSPPPQAQFSDGYSGPIPDTEAPSVFTDILEPPVTEAAYVVRDPITTKYQSPPRRPDSSYTINVDPEMATNGHGGKISIDINVNVQNEDRGGSNSHGPVQTTYQTPSEADLPPSSDYARPTESSYAGPTTTSGYKQRAPSDQGYAAPVTEEYAFSDLVDSTKPRVQPTDTYDSPTVKPRKKKPSYPRTYGSKVTDNGKPNDFVAPDYVTVNDDRPNDFVAPDYNTEIYKDDFTAPDIAGEYETPSAPVVDDYYGAPPHHDDYTAPVVEDYYQPPDEYFPEENYDDGSYYGHEAPGYDNFEEDYYIEKPQKHKHKKHKKHKKVKPFVDFGQGHYKPKQHSKPHYEEDFYEHEPHPHHEEYHDDYHYEPLEKPFYEPEPHYKHETHYEPEPHYKTETHYEPKPLYKPPTVYEEPYHEPLEKPIYEEEPYYNPEPYYEPPSYDEPYEHGNLYIEPVSKGYYEKTTELIPELKDVIKPLDWNVHDFSSWRKLLDPKRFGGTLSDSDYRPKSYGKHLDYEPEITNEIYDAANVYDEPLYYEDYTEKPNPYDVEYNDYTSQYYNPVEEYDTYDPYEPYFYKPQKKTVEIPKPFDIPFDHWLDSSGVGAFGLPSSTYKSYASPPVQYSYSHIGQRHHSSHHSDPYSQPYYATSLDEWVPSEKPLKYKPSYLQHHQKTQVELPFLTESLHSNPSPHHSAIAREIKPKLYTPPTIKPSGQIKRNFKFNRIEEEQTKPTDPGSIWTGLSSFVSSLDPRNHYRRHGAGMVSLGSDNIGFISTSDDMFLMGSQNHAVRVKPPSDFNYTGPTVNNVISSYSEVKSNMTTSGDGGVWPGAAPMSASSGHDLQVSLSEQDNSENVSGNYNNNVIKQEEKMHSEESVQIDNYLMDSSYFGSTILNMAKMLETYLR